MKNIDLELIEKLAENMNEHSLNEISLEVGEQKLVLKKEKKTVETVVAAAPQRTAAAAKLVEKVEKKEKTSEGVSGNVITSPMVGTFYRSPAPGAEVFVQFTSKTNSPYLMASGFRPLVEITPSCSICSNIFT